MCISSHFAHLYRSHDIERRVENTIGVIIVIISYASCTLSEPCAVLFIVTFEVGGVHHVIIECICIAALEWTVRVLYEDD